MPGVSYSLYFWVGVCRPVLKILTLFQTKIYDFPYTISDLTLKMYTLFQTLWCVANSATLNGFTAYGTYVTPQTMFVFFFFAINVYGNTRYSKTGIPDQNGKIYTLFQTKNAKKWYPLGRHIPSISLQNRKFCTFAHYMYFSLMDTSSSLSYFPFLNILKFI